MEPDHDNPTSELAAPPDAAERLWQRWQQGQRPDLDAFLAEAGPLPAAELSAVLRVDQRQRWQAGERVLAESYQQRYPLDRGDAEAAIDLVFNEFLLRNRLGERPDPAEYLHRFPEYADVLREQIDLDHAMQREADGLSAAKASHDPPALGRGGQAMSAPQRRESADVPGTPIRGLDQECDRFEVAWKAGQRPRLEEHLAAVPEPERPALLRELLLLEVVVLRCLEKEPARRLPNPDALEQALAQCACASDWSGTAAAWWRPCSAPATPT
jgi:hypothetical protein